MPSYYASMCPRGEQPIGAEELAKGRINEDEVQEATRRTCAHNSTPDTRHRLCRRTKRGIVRGCGSPCGRCVQRRSGSRLRLRLPDSVALGNNQANPKYLRERSKPYPSMWAPGVAGGTHRRSRCTRTRSPAARSPTPEVWLDGSKLVTIDLYSSTALARRIVFTRAVSPSVTHALEVRVQGTSGRPRVDVDAFVVLR